MAILPLLRVLAFALLVSGGIAQRTNPTRICKECCEALKKYNGKEKIDKEFRVSTCKQFGCSRKRKECNFYGKDIQPRHRSCLIGKSFFHDFNKLHTYTKIDDTDYAFYCNNLPGKNVISTTRSPTMNPTTLKPTVSPSTPEPTTAAPSYSPTTSKPTISPSTPEPTTAAPSDTPTTPAPTLSPTTEKPTLAPTTSPGLSTKTSAGDLITTLESKEWDFLHVVLPIVAFLSLALFLMVLRKGNKKHNNASTQNPFVKGKANSSSRNSAAGRGRGGTFSYPSPVIINSAKTSSAQTNIQQYPFSTKPSLMENRIEPRIEPSDSLSSTDSSLEIVEHQPPFKTIETRIEPTDSLSFGGTDLYQFNPASYPLRLQSYPMRKSLEFARSETGFSSISDASAAYPPPPPPPPPSQLNDLGKPNRHPGDDLNDDY